MEFEVASLKDLYYWQGLFLVFVKIKYSSFEQFVFRNTPATAKIAPFFTQMKKKSWNYSRIWE